MIDMTLSLLVGVGLGWFVRGVFRFLADELAENQLGPLIPGTDVHIDPRVMDASDFDRLIALLYTQGYVVIKEVDLEALIEGVQKTGVWDDYRTRWQKEIGAGTTTSWEGYGTILPDWDLVNDIKAMKKGNHS